MPSRTRGGGRGSARTIARLRRRLAETRAALRARDADEIDALVLSGAEGGRLKVLAGADAPYHALVETMNEGAVTLLADGTVLYSNRRFAELVQLPADRVAGGNFTEFIAAEDRPAFDALLRCGLAGSYRSFIHISRPDGVSVPVQISVRALAIEQALNPFLAVAVVTDLTEREQAAESLRASLHEKHVLLQEVHHRVKNNLQVIVSLLRMQARALEDPAAREPFIESQNRVRAMALVHEQLYASADLARLDLTAYVRTLSATVLRAYETQRVRLTLTCDIVPDLSLNLDAAVPLGLILTELLSNCVKHAFRGRTAGEVWITIIRHDDMISLAVADDGIGFPAELDPRQPRSLGLQIVADLTAQLRGTLTFERSSSPCVRIVFPDPGRNGE